MIVCTNCGAKNPDDATSCAVCGRKLQSLWTLTAARGGRTPGDFPWSALAPLMRTKVDERALKLVLRTLEVWTYAFILIAGAFATSFSENWWYLIIGLVVAGGLAWLRGILRM